MKHTDVKHFHDPSTGTFTYVVAEGGKAVVIDPVLDYVAASGRLSHESCDAVIRYLAEKKLELRWILETHAHADHLSAGRYLQKCCGGKLGVGEGIREVQATFKPVFNLGDDFAADGADFDHLFLDGEAIRVGDMQINVMQTPGHTSDSVTYVIGDAAFIGDTLFRPELGSARCDFPGGNARTLFASIQKIYQLPPDTRLFLCHDYPPADGEARAYVTVAEQLETNAHVRADTTRDDYVAMREARDATLKMPALIIPAIQVNIRAGDLPAKEDNDQVYLKIPVNRL